MKFKPDEKVDIRTFFTGQAAALVKLASDLQAGPPVHQVTRAEFERALEAMVDADPAFVHLVGVVTLTNLRDPQNATFLDPLIGNVLRRVAPPPPPPPAETVRLPRQLDTGGVLCDRRFAGIIASSAGLSAANALNAAQCSSTDGEAYPQFTSGVPMYHRTVDSADGQEGTSDRKHSGKKKITFFYERVGGSFYFVAAGVHTSMRTYRVTHVVASFKKRGNLNVGDAVDFHAPSTSEEDEEDVAVLVGK